MLPIINGATLCAGLVVSIGPQNTELIRCSIFKQSHFILASIYIFFDIVLILLGATGVGTLIKYNIVLTKIAASFSILLLLYFSFLAFKRMYHIHTTSPTQLSMDSFKGTARAAAIKKGIILSLFNPLAIMETVVIIGGVAGQYQTVDKLLFTVGAICASITWFYTVAFFGKKLSSFLQHPKKQRIFEGFIGSLLLTTASVVVFKLLL
jgi:L-lysine exporter family protein LysE/ArgO